MSPADLAQAKIEDLRLYFIGPDRHDRAMRIEVIR
jgi:hypothetical protein